MTTSVMTLSSQRDPRRFGKVLSCDFFYGLFGMGRETRPELMSQLYCLITNRYLACSHWGNEATFDNPKVESMLQLNELADCLLDSDDGVVLP